MLDDHLEEALEEYNEKVAALEINGTREEMLEALVNRGTILMLMESFTSSLSDMEDALDIVEEMKEHGERINTGTLVKIYENRGQLCYGEDNATMVSDYSKISSLMDDIHDGIRHYDHKGLISMCIGCAEDLLDEGYDENSVPFIEKGLELLMSSFDVWSTNRRIELLNLKGQAMSGMGLQDESYAAYTEAINIGADLYKQNKLEDEMELVFAFMYRGDISDKRREVAKMISDHESAADILEQLNIEGKLEDVQLLVNLHQGIATTLMDAGDIENSEKHLIRAIKLGMPAMDEAMDELGIKRPDQ